MKASTRLWGHRLLAAFIGGGAAAVTAGLATSLLAPQQFNLTSGAGVLNFFKLSLLCFVVNGWINSMAYLAKSPAPPEDLQVAPLVDDAAKGVSNNAPKS